MTADLVVGGRSVEFIEGGGNARVSGSECIAGSAETGETSRIRITGVGGGGVCVHGGVGSGNVW